MRDDNSHTSNHGGGVSEWDHYCLPETSKGTSLFENLVSESDHL